MNCARQAWCASYRGSSAPITVPLFSFPSTIAPAPLFPPELFDWSRTSPYWVWPIDDTPHLLMRSSHLHGLDKEVAEKVLLLYNYVLFFMSCGHPKRRGRDQQRLFCDAQSPHLSLTGFVCDFIELIIFIITKRLSSELPTMTKNARRRHARGSNKFVLLLSLLLPTHPIS